LLEPLTTCSANGRAAGTPTWHRDQPGRRPARAAALTRRSARLAGTAEPSLDGFRVRADGRRVPHGTPAASQRGAGDAAPAPSRHADRGGQPRQADRAGVALDDA